MHRKWWTLIAVSVATFMLLLDITVVNTALPAIEEDLGASFTDLQWVIDAYALALAALVLSAGSLADRLGRRRVFAAGLAVFSVASVLCALAPDPTFLNLARALQGVGGAVMFAVSLALIAQEFPAGRERGMAMGVYGATIGVAVAIGRVACFLVAPIAGSLLGRVPARVLLSIGLAGTGVGLLMMSGIAAGDEWTTLLGGFLVAGAAVGLLNPVIADVALSVVLKERSGMAAGINDTFRQVGIAVGIAVWGAIFLGRGASEVREVAPATTGERPRQLVEAASSGNLTDALGPGAVEAARAGFLAGMNTILVLGAILALAGSALALLLVREREIDREPFEREALPEPAAA